MQVKTSELSGPALDWAVAKCEGFTMTLKHNGWEFVAKDGTRFNGYFEPTWTPQKTGPKVGRSSTRRLAISGNTTSSTPTGLMCGLPLLTTNPQTEPCCTTKMAPHP